MMHDVVIIGGGHNGLVCSAYLAMAGLKVLVLDQRPVAGGVRCFSIEPKNHSRPRSCRAWTADRRAPGI